MDLKWFDISFRFTLNNLFTYWSMPFTWLNSTVFESVLSFLSPTRTEKASKMGCLSNPIPNVSIEKRNRDGTSNVARRACGRARGRSTRGLRIGRSCTNGARAPIRDILNQIGSHGSKRRGGVRHGETVRPEKHGLAKIGFCYSRKSLIR